METATHTTGDLVSILCDLLSYTRFDADMHSCDDECREDWCPAKLSERAEAILDDTQLWRLLDAAPEHRDALLVAQNAIKGRLTYETPGSGEHQELDWVLTTVNAALAKAA